MKSNFLAFVFLCCQIFVLNAYAGQDPIGWSLVPSSGFPSQTTVGSSYAVTYTLTNHLPFSMPITILRSYTGNTVTVDDKCSGKTLSTNGTCTISLSIQPAHTGKHTARITIVYGNNQVPLPLLTTTSISANTGDNIDGFVTQPLPPNTQVGTNYPVTFTFRNDSNSSVTATAVTASGFTPTTNTCTVALPANDACEVTGSFTPTTTGQATLGVTYTYNSGGSKSVSLSTTSNVSSGGGGCTQVTGTVPLPLPMSTYIYSDNVVKFTFTNHCDSGSITLGTASINVSLDGATKNSFFTKGSVSGANDTCSGATLNFNDSCSLYVSIIPTLTGSALSVEASIPYDNGANTAAAVSSEQVSAIPNQSTMHTLTFVNQCDFPVWYEFLNGNGGAASTGVNSPDPTPSGSRDPDDYKLPRQTGGAPYTKTLSFQAYENGKINARTGCNVDSTTHELICTTASCPTIVNSGSTATGTCTTSVGAGMPSTAAEAFMNNVANADGVYDVSIINGLNVPMEMKGLGPVSSTDPYACTAAGALIQPSTNFNPPIAACSWLFTPPNTGIDKTANYVFTSAGADDGCETDGDCTGSNLCGMAWNSNINTGAGVPINRRCGTFQGYWTVVDFIGYSSQSNWGSVDNNLYSVYQIAAQLPAAYGNSTANPGQATNYDLYGCVPTSNDSLDSGYDSGKSRVCGCYDWDRLDSPARTNVVQKCCTSTNTADCTNQSGVVDTPNPLWESTVFDRIKWLKTGCPTAYSYQFDDKSSQFTCNQTGQFTSYQIVFCPGGKTGHPNA